MYGSSIFSSYFAKKIRLLRQTKLRAAKLVSNASLTYLKQQNLSKIKQFTLNYIIECKNTRFRLFEIHKSSTESENGPTMAHQSAIYIKEKSIRDNFSLIVP